MEATSVSPLPPPPHLFLTSPAAYGQTGSGKTHTMEGPESDPGVNMRALAELFRVASERREDFAYTFSASMLEIYNEQVWSGCGQCVGMANA